MEGIQRANRFTEKGAKGLPPFPEDEAVPDTYTDKAARGMDGMIEVARWVGLGGKVCVYLLILFLLCIFIFSSVVSMF